MNRPARAVVAAVSSLILAACGGEPASRGDERSSTATAELDAGACLDLVATRGIASTGGGGPLGYAKCADEDGSCSFSRPADVAYGAAGSFAYKDGVTGTITFNNATFGDPIAKTVKSGYARISGGPEGYTWCADPGGTCGFNRPVDLAYGENGSFRYKCGVTGSFTAVDSTFGDSGRGIARSVYYRNAGGPDGYTWCGDEHGTCLFSQAVDVAFGANGAFATRSGVTGPITFDIATFGDPAPNAAKAGYYRMAASRIGPAGDTWCADEKGTCSFSQPVDVAYGANGAFAYKYNVSGTIVLTNAAFGDPAFNTLKAGYYRASTGGAADWAASWIWQSLDGPSNTWLRARKKVTLSARPTRASLRIAAENKYWLYINGQLVIPDGGLDLRPDLTNTYFDTVDITPYLIAGDNVIAALVWYKGGVDGNTERMTGSGGLLFDAAITGATPARVVSDSTWKASVHPAFARTSQQTQVGNLMWVEYPVNYDARTDQGDWTALAFDDTGWPAATQKGAPPSAPWSSLVDRTIPMLKNFGPTPYLNQASLPASLTANTTFLADVGNNLQGNAYLKLNAPAGVTVTIRMNPWYQEQYITKAGVQEYMTYQWQNTSGVPWSKHSVEYAFSNVTGTVQILDLKFRPLSYDTEFVGSFTSDDARLNTLWAKSRNTSYVCMRDQFYDCPDRERGQWWGDVSEEILYSFYLYDSKASLLAKKGFRELLNTQKPDGSLYTTAPGIQNNLPDQNMAAISALGDYYLYTGDTALVTELYPKVATYIKQFVAANRNTDGLQILSASGGAWNWIDWGMNLDVQIGSANTVSNGLFVRLLENAKSLAQASGNTADVAYYQGLQDQVRLQFNRYFWNSSANAYVFGVLNGAQSAAIDDRSNAWAMLAGMADSAKLNGILNVLNTRQNASPYQERYIEEAMFLMGNDNDAINRMLTYYKPDIDSWSQTMWERVPASYNSNNHAWAASPAYLLGAFVAGVRPTAPGWARYKVMPLLGPLTSAAATVPSPHGLITVSHALSDTTYLLQLTSPSGTQAVVGIPRKHSWTSITANGVTVWSQGNFVSGVPGVSGAGTDNLYINLNVAPGTWRLVATGPSDPQGFTRCTDEGGTCTFGLPVDGAYGANGHFNIKTGLTGIVTFDNASFGDPIAGVVKSGHFKAEYVRCADEDGTCTFTRPTDVAYGAGSSFLYRTGVTGTITFNNATFGGDPIPNVPKAGFFKIAAP